MTIEATLLLIVFLLVAIVSALFAVVTGKNDSALRFARALPQILEQIVDFVKRADQVYDQILVDYKGESERTGDDPRLLWVTDQVIAFCRQHNITPDRAWLKERIEIAVRLLKDLG